MKRTKFFLSEKWNQLQSLKYPTDLSEIPRADFLFWCSDADNYSTIEGLYFSPIIDPLVENLNQYGKKCSKIIFPYSSRSNKKNYVSSFNYNRIHFLSKILVKLIKTDFGILRALLNRVLLNTNAKVSIGIGMPAFLVEFLKSKNQIVIEILHGFGYNQIPWGLEKRNSLELPNIIWTLDKPSFDTFSQFSKEKGIDLEVISHPLIDFIGENLFAKKKLFLKSIINKNQYSKIVLITLSYGYDGDHPDYNGILKNGLLFECLLDLIKSRKDILWLIKRHPVQMQRKYDHQLELLKTLQSENNNLEWSEVSQLPILSIADLVTNHISMESMSTFELAEFGVCSLLLCPTLKRNEKKYKMKNFDDLINLGYVFLGEPNYDSVLSWVLNTSLKEKRRYLFDSNAESATNKILSLK